MTAGKTWREGGAHVDAPAGPLPGRRGRDRAGRAASSGPGASRPPRRRWSLGLRRIIVVLICLLLAGALGLGGLLLVTPSVSNAPALARALDRAHHAPYPGPAVPARFAAALVATEDHRFYYEPGIDPFAIARVIWGHLTNQPDQGGATLYQQLAKMLYSQGRPGVTALAEDVALGIKLDFSFPKAQILRMYADVAYFGHGYTGLAQASCGYFGVTPAQLSWPQAAMMAGLVQAPSAYDPLANYPAARARELHVLSRLAATGQLSQAQAARLYREPLRLARGPHPGCAAG